MKHILYITHKRWKQSHMSTFRLPVCLVMYEISWEDVAEQIDDFNCTLIHRIKLVTMHQLLSIAQFT